MNEQDRIAKYDRACFTERNCPEIESWRRGILRPGDMGAALCYALGYTDYEQVRQALGIPENNPHWIDTPLTFEKQIEAVLDLAPSLHYPTCLFETPLGGKKPRSLRDPGKILDIGCGRGELITAFRYLGLGCMGLDPSPVLPELASKFMSAHITQNMYLDPMYNMPFGDAGENFRYVSIRTAIFCESIEHIPANELRRGLEWLLPSLAVEQGLLIITNWIDNHPILPDGTGYDHITTVDDALYDWLAGQARRTVFRQGSHLVLQF